MFINPSGKIAIVSANNHQSQVKTFDPIISTPITCQDISLALQHSTFQTSSLPNPPRYPQEFFRGGRGMKNVILLEHLRAGAFPLSFRGKDRLLLQNLSYSLRQILVHPTD
jgi:hypothetical protein